MARLDPETQLLAIGLLNYADDEGYFLAEPILVRSALRPFDEDSAKTRRCLDTLVEVGWIELSTSEKHGPIGHVVNFEKHQNVDRPKPSKIKAYARRRIADESATAQRSIGAGTGNREQGTENDFMSKPAAPVMTKAANFVAREIARTEFEWGWDNCKVVAARLDVAGLVAVAQPWIEAGIHADVLLKLWPKAVQIAHKAAVDQLTARPEAYAIGCWRDLLSAELAKAKPPAP